MPTLLFGIIYLSTPFLLAPFNHIQFLVAIFISTFFIPLIGVLALAYTGSVQSVVMNDRSERAVPFTFTAIFYWIMTYFFFNQFKENLVIIVIMLGVSTTISLVAVINYFWKISAHSAGVMGLVGFLFVINIKYPEVQLTYPIALLIILSGIIMSVRLKLQVHNLNEVLAGAFLGFVLNFTLLFFFT
jgi:membrane-associated phospholipid phosphatase